LTFSFKNLVASIENGRIKKKMLSRWKNNCEKNSWGMRKVEDRWINKGNKKQWEKNDNYKIIKNCNEFEKNLMLIVFNYELLIILTKPSPNHYISIYVGNLFLSLFISF
jgi:hypothetical protein